MKAFLRFTLLVVIFSAVCAVVKAQAGYSAPVPDSVKKAFKIKYPKATNVDWDTSEDIPGAFEAEFLLNKDRFTAIFNVQGQWLETDNDIEKLPDAIMKSIGEKFPDHEILESQQVLSPIKGTFFRVKLEKNTNEKWEVEFAANGDVMQKERLGADDK